MSPTVASVALSVVVTTRERSEGCLRLCTVLEDQFAEHPGLPVEIVLVFDGCEPYVWTPTAGRYRPVHLPTRHGIAKARNVGVRHARGEIVAFLDDDAVPVPGWVSSALAAFATYPQLVAFGGRVIGADQHNLYAQLRDQVYYRETFGSWYVIDAGGFDEALPAYSDVELGRRLQLHRRGALVAGMTIRHDHPSTFGQYMRRCYRSGRARGVLWAHRRYPQDAPRLVVTTIAANVLWNNVTHRARRIAAGWIRAAIVLSCQEVLHGIGYTRSLVSTR
jgi:GT2 family glycosyltransferase